MAKKTKADKKKKGASEELSEFAANAKAAAERKDREDRDKLSELMAVVDRRLAAIRESFYDIGQALRTIRDEKLYRLDEPKAKDFDSFLRKRAWFDRSYAYTLMDIATYYERETALGLPTISIATEIVKYAQRKTGKREDAQRIAASGEIEGREITSLTAEDVRAMKPSKKKRKKKAKPEEIEARKEARAFDEWLAKHGLPGAVARAAEDKRGDWIVQVRVPVAVLARFRGSKS